MPLFGGPGSGVYGASSVPGEMAWNPVRAAVEAASESAGPGLAGGSTRDLLIGVGIVILGIWLVAENHLKVRAGGGVSV